MVARWTPPPIPKRLPVWEAAFLDVIAHHDRLGFAWGVSDCIVVPADLCFAMTGVDPLKGMRGYRSETGALRLLSKHGCKDVEDVLKLVFPPLPPALARRGDCGIVEQECDGEIEKLTVVFTGEHVKAKTPDGNVYLRRTRVVRAYAIGAR